MVINRCILGYINVGEKRKKKRKKRGKKIEKSCFFLPGSHLGVRTTLTVERPARNLSVYGQGARFLQGDTAQVASGFAATGWVGESWDSVPGIHFIKKLY